MAAGYDLKEGEYVQSPKTVREIKNTFSKFFEKSSKKESTYKYVMLKAILDCMIIASDKTYKITFDALFSRFSEIYWVLVFKHRIPQKKLSINSSETLAEKIIQKIASKYKIKRKTTFAELSDSIRYEMMTQMKKKCSKYVFGALYAETDQLFYSFSKERQWIILNPLVVEYFSKHLNAVQAQNYQAWAKFYTDIIMLGEDASYYQRLLKREFGNNSVMLCANPNTQAKRTVAKKNELQNISNAYDSVIAGKTRFVLQQHPDIGLYVAQISEKIGEDKELVREILDNSFWSKKEGSRYFYQNITDEDILNDAIFQNKDTDDFFVSVEDTGEIAPELMKLLDDPELLIKKLKFEQSKKTVDAVKVQKKIKSTSEKIIAVSNKSMQRNWEREEVVILVVEYFKTKNLSAEEISESHRKVSEFLRKREEILTGQSVDDIFRNIAGIRMQSGRIRCLDPDTKYSGMQGTKIQKEIVREYLTNPKKIIAEAKSVYKKYK